MSKVHNQNETRTHRSNERAAAERAGDIGHHASHSTVGGHDSHQHVDQGEQAHHGHANAAEHAGDTDVGETGKGAATQYKYKEGYATGDAKDTGKTDTSDKTGWQKGHDLAASSADEGESGGDQSQAWKQIPTTDLVKKLMQAPPKALQELGKKLYENLAAGKEGAKELFNPREEESKTSAAAAKGSDASSAQAAKDARTQAKYTSLGGEDQDATSNSLKSSTGSAKADPADSTKASSGGEQTLTLAQRQEAYRAKAKKAAGELSDQMFSDALDNLGKNEKSNKGQKTTSSGSKGGSGAAGAGSSGQSAAGSGSADATGGAGGGGGGGGGTSSASSSDNTGSGLDGLSGMELVQAVMLSAAAEASKSAQDLAKQVQSNTNKKNQLRAEIAPIRDSLAQTNSSSMTADQKAQNAKMSDLSDDMDAIGDDNQILFIKLQNATQQYSSMLQACSNVSKTLFDIDKAVVGNIGH